MAKAAGYDDLIFQLGDLARDRLANVGQRPRAMARVFGAEEAVSARRDELEALEGQLNALDTSYQDFLANQEAERVEQQAVVKKWQRAVDGILEHTKKLRKHAASIKAALRYETAGLKKAEARHNDLEMISHHDPRKVSVSRENLKKLRLALLRRRREIEEAAEELAVVLTPRPGQPGAQGVLAYKRLLEMEDEGEARREEHEQAMAKLDQVIAAKEEEVAASEDFLDQALYLLGKEVYADRINDPVLERLYSKIDGP